MSMLVALGDSERMAAEDIMLNTRQVMKGLEALRSEHRGLRQRLEEALDGPALELLEEKHDLVRKSLEGLELGIAEAQVRQGSPVHTKSAVPEFKGSSVHTKKCIALVQGVPWHSKSALP
uniref:Uncharacterized protein n=1 Tax=Anolis carolinensis TaxID=28377 RepID=A0A803TAM7_ANOCA